MKKIFSISLVSASMLFAATPIHDVMDSKLKGKSFGGTLDDHEAAQDGLGIISLQNHSGTRDINNELIEHKVLNKLLKGESDKTKTADVRTSLTSGLLGTEQDKNVLTNIGVELTPPGLYEFTTHTFTSCGILYGNNGPVQMQCNSAYNTDWDDNSEYFKVPIQGIQEWTVPADGTYRIVAKGGEGGRPAILGYGVTEERRGTGAIISGDFNLSAGEVLRIVVGQQAKINNAGNAGNGGGHGGGGSFVWKKIESSPLIVAGGGGGLSICNNTSNNYDYCAGKAGSLYSSGTPSYSNATNYGTNGSNGTSGISPAKGWNSMYSLSDFRGSQPDSYYGQGGFGGGGRGSDTHTHGGGGGGGYSGGGNGHHGKNTGYGNSDGRNGGGGGGSYNVGTNKSSSTGNRGNGSVTITKL